MEPEILQQLFQISPNPDLKCLVFSKALAKQNSEVDVAWYLQWAKENGEQDTYDGIKFIKSMRDQDWGHDYDAELVLDIDSALMRCLLDLVTPDTPAKVLEAFATASVNRSITISVVNKLVKQKNASDQIFNVLDVIGRQYNYLADCFDVLGMIVVGSEILFEPKVYEKIIARTLDLKLVGAAIQRLDEAKSQDQKSSRDTTPSKNP